MSEKQEPIYVTRPSLPELDDYIAMLRQIWESKQLTNMGKLHEELEKKLAEFLGVKFISLFCNGTLALITALRALDIKGSVITTPYSFVATTHALYWTGNTPIFIDVEPEFCNLDPSKIETAINSTTSAIMPVHTYGNPVDVIQVQDIAARKGLKVIYDAAHAFGVNLNGSSLLNYGDLSVLSFHATKVFSTLEGGAIVCHDEKDKEHIDYLRNFGFANEVTVVGPGINAKMNELQAAYGLLQLKMFNDGVTRRKEITYYYKDQLNSVRGIRFINPRSDVEQNYSYLPIFIEEDYPISRDALYNKLRESNIFARRYFYPLISKFPPYDKLPSAKERNMPVATRLAEQVICLPIYSDLELDLVEKISNIIKEQ